MNIYMREFERKKLKSLRKMISWFLMKSSKLTAKWDQKFLSEYLIFLI